MKRVNLTFIMALKVLEKADPAQLEEWKAVENFATTTPMAREMMEYSPLKWAILIGNEPVAAFGCKRTTSTVLTAWCITVVNVPKKVWVFMLREMKKATRSIFDLGMARRIHALCCTNRWGPVFFASKAGMNPLAHFENYGTHKDFKLMAITPRDLS